MFDWYQLFMLAVTLLWIGSTPADRGALRIVLIASLASWLLVTFGTSHTTSPFKLVFPATVELVTISALLRTPWNRSCRFQAGLLMVAWIAHVLCFLDLMLRTDMIYSVYEWVLGLVSLAQVLAFHDTYLHHLRRLGRWLGDLGAGRAGTIRASGHTASILHHPRRPGV